MVIKKIQYTLGRLWLDQPRKSKKSKKFIKPTTVRKSDFRDIIPKAFDPILFIKSNTTKTEHTREVR